MGVLYSLTVKMAISKNLPLLKNHFRKHWQERVKVHFNQAGQKYSRRQSRLAKAAKVAPKPVDSLRPIVRCPTVKYNRKVRAGRGFTLAEVKAAGLSAKYARTIGIAVDHRRQNEYQSKLVIFSKKSAAEGVQVSAAATFPVEQSAPESAPRAVVVPEKTAYRTLREARDEKRYKGIREKRAKEKAEAE